MRANGVPDFPDPTPSGGYGLAFGGRNSGIDFGAPLFRLAQRRCVSILIHRRAIR